MGIRQDELRKTPGFARLKLRINAGISSVYLHFGLFGRKEQMVTDSVSVGAISSLDPLRMSSGMLHWDANECHLGEICDISTLPNVRAPLT